MRTKFFIFTMVMLLASTFNVNAASIIWGHFANQAELDAHLASDDTSTTATAAVQAGGGDDDMLLIGNYNTYSDFADFVWEINGDNAFSLSYDGDATGTYRLDVSNAGGSAGVETKPTDWFNELVFSFSGGPAEINFTGDINGESFSLHAPYLANPSWDGILFEFPDFNADNMEAFVITGNINIQTGALNLLSNDFRGQFDLLQTVPEPSSMSMLITSIITLGASRLRRKRK